MPDATYKLTFKGTHYAQADVSVDPGSPSSSISVSTTAFAWLKDAYGPDAFEWAICDDYRVAAIAGAEYAVANLRSEDATRHPNVVITRIHAHPAHTSPDDVSFASCMAVWAALGVDGGARIDRGTWPPT